MSSDQTGRQIKWKSQALQSIEAEERKAVGGFYDKMLQSRDVAVSCLKNESLDVQRVALSMLSTRWPPTEETESQVRNFLINANSDLEVDAISALAMIVCKLRGTKVSTTLAEFIQDTELSDSSRAKLYSLMKLQFGDTSIQRATFESGPIAELTVDDVDQHVLEFCVENDQVSRLLIDRYPNHPYPTSE